MATLRGSASRWAAAAAVLLLLVVAAGAGASHLGQEQGFAYLRP